MGLWYRVGQFGHQVTARPLSGERLKEVAEHLTPAEMGLYGRYDAGDQWHSYRVLKMLCEAGHNDPALLKAALLHDVGKTRVPFGPIQRSIVSLVEKVLPETAASWGQMRLGEASWWQRPFVVSEQHPQWSAEMAEDVGCSETAVALMRRHQDKITFIHDKEDQLLFYLQWADNQN